MHALLSFLRLYVLNRVSSCVRARVYVRGCMSFPAQLQVTTGMPPILQITVFTLMSVSLSGLLLSPAIPKCITNICIRPPLLSYARRSTLAEKARINNGTTKPFGFFPNMYIFSVSSYLCICAFSSTYIQPSVCVSSLYICVYWTSSVVPILNFKWAAFPGTFSTGTEFQAGKTKVPTLNSSNLGCKNGKKKNNECLLLSQIVKRGTPPSVSE